MNISIILPIHNEKESLEVMVRLLNSSLKFNHEIIVVYESKNDNSIKIGEKLSKEFSNFKIIQNKYEKGVRFAVQTGVEESRYDIIFITNPTNLHHKTIENLKFKTKNLFIEKPIFDKIQDCEFSSGVN